MLYSARLRHCFHHSLLSPDHGSASPCLLSPPAAVSAEVVPRPFRLAGKAIFLTWPQNDVSKEDLMAKVVALWEAKLSWAVVAEESHKSGEPHVHAIVQFAERLGPEECESCLGCAYWQTR